MIARVAYLKNLDFSSLFPNDLALPGKCEFFLRKESLAAQLFNYLAICPLYFFIRTVHRVSPSHDAPHTNEKMYSPNFLPQLSLLVSNQI